MPKLHTSRGSNKSVKPSHKTEDTDLNKAPQYPNEQNPEQPALDHDPVMLWQFKELQTRVEILEAAINRLIVAPEQDGEGAAASTPA
jgi:hypothetical protein